MNDQDRYQRQEGSFSHERRTQTFIVDLGAHSAPLTSALMKAGAAAAGVANVWSDHHGSGGSGRHWLLGAHDALVRMVNGSVQYDYLDPRFVREDIERGIASCENAWVVVHANDPAGGLAALEQLAGLGVRVLLTLAAPGGVLVERHPYPDTALERLRAMAQHGPVPAGPAELAVAAAGVTLNEVMLAGASPDDVVVAPRTVLFYSLRRRRRGDLPAEATAAELVEELRQGPERAMFTGRRLKQVGAGALGNWTSLAIALDGGVAMDVIDGDPVVEPHNLNRQVLLVRGVGKPKAPVLVGELRGLDPEGVYAERVQYVEQPEDLEPLEGVAAVILAPDNNTARVIGADAAWRAGVPCAVGGTGVAGGQLVVQQPDRACFRCITGFGDEPAEPVQDAGSTSCAEVANESIVASNMVVAGLLVSELRVALAGGRCQNQRFFGDSGGAGNRLMRMPSDAECSHRALAAEV